MTTSAWLSPDCGRASGEFEILIAAGMRSNSVASATGSPVNGEMPFGAAWVARNVMKSKVGEGEGAGVAVSAVVGVAVG